MAIFLLFPFFSLALIGSLPPSTADDLIRSVCEGGENYTPDSIFQANLRNLVISLSSTAPNTGFAQNTIGDNPNRVYGLAICRGDINATSCRSCLAGAPRDVAYECRGKKEANIYYEFCLLRYSNEDFFSKPSGTLFHMWNPLNASNVAATNRLLGRLLEDLAETAASSERMFAAGSLGDDSLDKVYALVQCTRDLAPKACQSCLQEGIPYSARCCGTRKGASIFGESCFIRFEQYQFFNATAAFVAKQGEKKKRTAATVTAAVVVPLIALFAIVAAISIYNLRKRRDEESGNVLPGEAVDDHLNQGCSASCRTGRSQETVERLAKV